MNGATRDGEGRASSFLARPDACLQGGGEMGARMRTVDWSKTPLGPVSSWTPSLRAITRFLLVNRFPLLLWWGPDQVQLYNDACQPVLGDKHPRSMGQPARECWPEIWHIIGPPISTLLAGGPLVWRDDLCLQLKRHGFTEETHFSVACRPVPDERAPNGIGGVLVTVHELTGQVLAERRAAALRDLGVRASSARTEAEACAFAADALGHHSRDVPFALIYLLDDDGRTARITGAAGTETGAPVSPAVVRLGDGEDGASVWPLASTLATKSVQVVDDLGARFGAVPPGPWGDPPRRALVLPLNLGGHVVGVLVVGVSSRLNLDEAYRSFLHLASVQITSAIARARAIDEERRRAESAARESEHRYQALRGSEERFRTMADGSPVILWVTDAQGGNRFVNRTYREYFGVTIEEVEGDGWQPFFHPEDAAKYVGDFRAAVRNRTPFDGEARIRRKDGAWRWMATHGEPRFAPGGEFLGHVGITQDVTERKHLEQELREANRRKTDFLAILSHELRNPLTPLKNGVYLLDRVPPGSAEATRAKEVIHRQVDHLARLVDDLLDISRIDHGKITLHRYRFDARDVVRRACEDARPLFEERGIALRLELGAEPLWVDADPTRVAQIAGNLLGNAAKFTERSGAVNVILAERDGVCELRIRDSGIGIEPHLLDWIFEPFAQADRTRTYTTTGMGLGLALVKSLATMHGGTVRAVSEGAGRGAELLVTLPLAPAPEPREAPKPAAVPSLSVLIIEDDPDAGETLADMLRLEGHRTRLVLDGRAGVATFSRWRPDVLVCDIGLPDMSGYEVIQNVRAAANGGTAFAVALTGYAQPEDVERTRTSGFDAHLPKPLSMERLDAILAEAARRRR